jgi:guanidinobutyrase
MVHIDAHADANEAMFGERVTHGTPFRRAVEEGLLDADRVVQIGLRGSGYAADDFDWPRKQGFRVVPAEECWHRSLTPLMEEVREQVGGGPVYLSFDIDGLDPAFAGGTGTPEIGGLTTAQGLEVIRGCRGLPLVGCDLVEVAPAYDTSGNTALGRPPDGFRCGQEWRFRLSCLRIPPRKLAIRQLARVVTKTGTCYRLAHGDRGP